MNGGDIPYVDVTEFFPILGTLYENKKSGYAGNEYTFKPAANGHIMSVHRADNDAFMMIDAERDEIFINDLNIFISYPDERTLLGLVSSKGTTGASELFTPLENIDYDRHGYYTDFDLSEYMIDLIMQNGVCYVPLQTLNDILVSPLYDYFIFNGEKVLLANYETSELLEERYTAPGEMSSEFALFNYNELRFNLDQFYGLKPEHNISSFGQLFTDLIGDLAGGDPVAFDKALTMLTMKYLDDMHSGVTSSSCLAGPPEEPDLENLDLAGLNELFDSMGWSLSQNQYNSMLYMVSRYTHNRNMNPYTENMEVREIYDYTEVGDTAIITFDSFTAKRDDYYTYDCTQPPADTIELIIYANHQLYRENCPIKHVVLDLSYNSGGDADAAAFVTSWFAGSAVFMLRDTLTGAQSVCAYRADVNLDGVQDETAGDTVPFTMDLYCMISPISFSCGNLVPAALKGSPRILLIGKTTGGGSCVVRPCCTASGAIFQISGCMQLSTLKNGSFYNTDMGIDPDIVIGKTDTMYDREQLVEFIHNIK